jgi:hypothetical protein
MNSGRWCQACVKIRVEQMSCPGGSHQVLCGYMPGIVPTLALTAGTLPEMGAACHPVDLLMGLAGIE